MMPWANRIHYCPGGFHQTNRQRRNVAPSLIRDPEIPLQGQNVLLKQSFCDLTMVHARASGQEW